MPADVVAPFNDGNERSGDLVNVPPTQRVLTSN